MRKNVDRAPPAVGAAPPPTPQQGGWLQRRTQRTRTPSRAQVPGPARSPQLFTAPHPASSWPSGPLCFRFGHLGHFRWSYSNHRLEGWVTDTSQQLTEPQGTLENCQSLVASWSCRC